MSPTRRVPGFVSSAVDASPPPRPAAGLSVRRLGMRLFLVSLSILFAAALVGVLVVRLRAPVWPPPGSAPLPAGLWIGTILLVMVSALLMAAVRAARERRSGGLRRLLVAAAALGGAFLLVQSGNWLRMVAAGLVPRQSLFAFAFYVLTALHALHVAGGLLPLGLVSARAGRGRYLADPEPVELVAHYWHFLGATWLAIFLVLEL